jgi:glycosyltransferase involved in cell wall biosynthesis
MALGVPVLCHRDSIYAEYIDDGVDGWIYDDVTTLCSTIEALRSNRSGLLATGGSARAKARRLFEPHALADAYVEVVRRWRSAA